MFSSKCFCAVRNTQRLTNIRVLVSLRDFKIPEHLRVNLEEWACLAVLVNADITEGDVYGIKPKAFLEGLCQFVMQAHETAKLRAGEKASLEVVAQDLRRQICYEAKASGKGRKPDFKATFDLFDTDRSGSISLEELRSILHRLQLLVALPDHQIPSLMALFDSSKRGVVTLAEFILFAQKGTKDILDGDWGGDKEADKDIYDFVEEEDDDYSEWLSSNTPPTTISQNADCDWLIWFIYRRCCKFLFDFYFLITFGTDCVFILFDVQASWSP